MKKGTSHQGNEDRQWDGAVLQEHGKKKMSAKSMLRSADGDWGASKLAQEYPKWGVRSAEWNPGALIQAEEHRWGWSSALPEEECRKGGGWVRSTESNIGVLVPLEEFPPQAEEHGNGGIVHRIK